MADTGKSNSPAQKGHGSRNCPSSSQFNKQYPLDFGVVAKLKKIESSGGLMSIAEAISRERKLANANPDNSAIEDSFAKLTSQVNINHHQLRGQP